MSRRRILLIGGAAASLVNFRGPLIARMIADGCEVHAAAPDFDAAPGVLSALDDLGATAHRIALNRAGTDPIADIGCLFGLWRLMRRVRPDIVLGYTIKPVVYGLLAGWAARVPKRHAMITGLGYAFTGEARGKRALIRRLACGLYRFALRRASGVIFQNPDDCALFRELGLLPEGVPVGVVNGSGVDMDRFAPAPFPDGPVRFLMIARLLGDKGVREYAAAARRVRAAHPEVGFHLVGGRDPNPGAIPLAEVQGWQEEGALTWRGALADVRPEIAAAHVCVLPSYREGTPRAVLEGMAMGRPAITTDAPGCRETVIDGESGYLIPPRDAEALARRMLEFVEDRDRIARMGAAAHARCREKYDVRLVNRQVLEALGLG